MPPTIRMIAPRQNKPARSNASVADLKLTPPPRKSPVPHRAAVLRSMTPSPYKLTRPQGTDVGVRVTPFGGS